MYRVGLGYDIHRLVADRPLILGGVTIPHYKGLAGHSDADALTHAIIDAMLGALSLGDIGRHFPDTRAQFRDADSMELLRRTLEMVRDQNYAVANIDANIIAEAPQLAPHIPAIQQRLAEVMNIRESDISVKAKTNEEVGPEGREEAIRTQAVVLLRQA